MITHGARASQTDRGGSAFSASPPRRGVRGRVYANWYTDIAVAREGEFIAWHEERFPALATGAQTIGIPGARGQ